MLSKKFISLILISMILILNGCSSGGGGDTITNDRNLSRTGVFLDSAVIGIGYRIGNFESTTGRDGSFLYEDGQSVTFFIGDIILGTTLGKPIVTPLDLITSGQVNEFNSTVINIIRLLQTFDYDSDPSNGLEIIDNIRNSATGNDYSSINIHEAANTFDKNPIVINSVRNLTAFTLMGPRNLVSVDKARAHFEQVMIQLGLKDIEETQTCSNGNVIPVSATCPPSDIRLCPDGTTVALNEQCPSSTIICPNGTVVLIDQVCPIDTQTCPNGSVIPVDQQCPDTTKVCSDGSVVLITEPCSIPSNTDAAGHTSDEVLANYSGSFAGYMYDNSDNGVTYGTWSILFRTTNNVTLNSETNLWNLDVTGTVVGVDMIPGCGTISTMFGYISSTGILDIALECNSTFWVEAQFSNNFYAAQGPVYMLSGTRQQIGKFNGGHNDWSVDVNGASKLGFGQSMDTFDGLYGILSVTDANNIIPGRLDATMYLGSWANRIEDIVTFAFINFNGEYITLEINNFRIANVGYRNNYWSFALDGTTTSSTPTPEALRMVVLSKSNGDLIVYSPYDSYDTSSYSTPENTLFLRGRNESTGEYDSQPVPGTAYLSKSGTLTSSSFFSQGERFEGLLQFIGSAFIRN